MSAGTINDTEVIKKAVADDAVGFAAWLFPDGRRTRSKWNTGDLAGSPGRSLQIALTGEYTGYFRDWATGERGDCIDLVMAKRGLDFPGAARVLRERYNLPTPAQESETDDDEGKPAATRPVRAARATKPKAVQLPRLPKLEGGSRADLRRLSASRNLSPVALALARDRGLLWFYDSREGRAWLITDRARRNAQARRLDGQPWAWNGRKAWTLRDSCASWPIGLPESEPFPAVAVCEGGPDFVAAFHHALASGVAERLAPVCMVGASLSIAAECLPAFAGKRVRVFVHDDAEGLSAAQRWAGQLRNVGASVDGFAVDGLTRSDGARVKDLCDLATIDADSWEAHRAVVENCLAWANAGRAA